MPIGTLNDWDNDRGFGFITPEGRRPRECDIYAHCRQLSGGGSWVSEGGQVRRGMKVVYEIGWDSERGKHMATTWGAWEGKPGDERRKDEGDVGAPPSSYINSSYSSYQNSSRSGGRYMPYSGNQASAIAANNPGPGIGADFGKYLVQLGAAQATKAVQTAAALGAFGNVGIPDAATLGALGAVSNPAEAVAAAEAAAMGFGGSAAMPSLGAPGPPPPAPPPLSPMPPSAIRQGPPGRGGDD